MDEVDSPVFGDRYDSVRSETIYYTHPKYGWTSTYGGKLVENFVQAVCRDIMAEAIIRLERAGIPVVLHVHDEVILELDDEAQLDEAGRIMVEIPSWADSFPIAAEGFTASRYTKESPSGEEKKWSGK